MGHPHETRENLVSFGWVKQPGLFVREPLDAARQGVLGHGDTVLCEVMKEHGVDHDFAGAFECKGACCAGTSRSKGHRHEKDGGRRVAFLRPSTEIPGREADAQIQRLETRLLLVGLRDPEDRGRAFLEVCKLTVAFFFVFDVGEQKLVDRDRPALDQSVACRLVN